MLTSLARRAFFLRQKEVAGVAVLDGHDLSHLAELGHAFQKDDVHGSVSLLHAVGQEREEPRALDRLGELALVLGADGGDARWHDLAALGNVTLQKTRVLVVDLGRVIALERIGLAAAEKTVWLPLSSSSP